MKTNNQYIKIALIFLLFAILMGLLYYRKEEVSQEVRPDSD